MAAWAAVHAIWWTAAASIRATGVGRWTLTAPVVGTAVSRPGIGGTTLTSPRACSAAVGPFISRSRASWGPTGPSAGRAAAWMPSGERKKIRAV